MASVVILDSKGENFSHLKSTLERAGIEVQEVPCVVSALEAMSASSVELLVASDSVGVLDIPELLRLKNLNTSLQQTRSMVVSHSARIKSDCYKLGCDDFVTLPCEDSELLFRVHSLLRRRSGGELQGSLREVSLVDVIQMLSAAGKSGVLHVRVEAHHAELYFGQGQVRHAVLEDQTGEDAFLALLRVARESGEFSFNSRQSVEEVQSIEKRTDHLLLGLASILDEESQKSV